MGKNIDIPEKALSDLIGERLYFKPVEEEDATKLHDFLSDKEVKKFIGWPLMTTLEETKKHILKLQNEEKAKTHTYASVIQKETGELIGTVMIFSFDHEAKHAEVGYVFHKKHWGKGHCTEAVAMMDEFAAKTLKLRKLHARVTDANIGSIKVLEKNGYKEEGRLKDYYFIEGSYYDLLFFGKFL